MGTIVQDIFSKIDHIINSFRKWAKNHRVLGVIAYIVVFALMWPIIIAYLIARVLIKKVPNGVGKTLAMGLIAFGLICNFGWALGLANPQPAEKKQETANQTVQEQPKQIEQAKVEEVKPKLYKIVEVVDGDTVKVDYEGKIETIRLIGMDTPETVDPRTTVQCFGTEASNRAKELLTGKSVQLEKDDSQSERDKYNRLLRYVLFEDGANFNKQMIADGFAYEYTYEVPYKYQQEFKSAQTEATNASKGLWSPSTCSGQRTKPQPVVTTPAPTATPSQPTANCNIKGNISSSDEKIYHVPGGQYYDKTQIDTSKGERYFCSEAEAVNAGWRKSKV